MLPLIKVIVTFITEDVLTRVFLYSECASWNRLVFHFVCYILTGALASYLDDS